MVNCGQISRYFLRVEHLRVACVAAAQVDFAVEDRAEEFFVVADVLVTGMVSMEWWRQCLMVELCVYLGWVVLRVAARQELLCYSAACHERCDGCDVCSFHFWNYDKIRFFDGLFD